MYAIERMAPGLVALTLPAGTGVPRPWGDPSNVYVLEGRLPTLVDTGAPGARDALVAALRELGLGVDAIRRVILTGPERNQTGGLPLFAQAVVFAADDPATRSPATWERARRDDLVATARALLALHPNVEGWSHEEVDRVEAAWLDGVPSAVDLMAADEGLVIAAGDTNATAMVTPGAVPGGLSIRVEGSDALLAGRLFDLTDEHALADPSTYAEHLLRVSQVRPAWVGSLVGRVQRHPSVLFRATNLSVTNLLSNLQFVLTGTRNVEEVTWRDRGYRPRSVLRYAAWVMRYRSLLDELHRAGVAGRSGEGPLPDYTIDIPARLEGGERG